MRRLKASEQARVDLLLPHVREKLIELRKRLAAIGVETFVGSTMRGDAEQLKHFAAGRSTVARPYWHGAGRAIDLYVYDTNKRAVDVRAQNKAAYDTMHAEAAALGFRVLGWKALRGPRGLFTDPYHIEWRDGLAPEEALRRYAAGVDRSFRDTRTAPRTAPTERGDSAVALVAVVALLSAALLAAAVLT